MLTGSHAHALATPRPRLKKGNEIAETPADFLGGASAMRRLVCFPIRSGWAGGSKALGAGLLTPPEPPTVGLPAGRRYQATKRRPSVGGLAF
jgi:hypothetical protein